MNRFWKTFPALLIAVLFLTAPIKAGNLIDSLYVSPEVPSDTDVVMLIVAHHFPTSPCEAVHFSFEVSPSNKRINVMAGYELGEAMAISYCKDTFYDDAITAGNYLLTYYVNAGPFKDTTSKQLYITSTTLATQVEPGHSPELIKVRGNPAGDNLYLGLYGTYQPEIVKLFDLAGKEVLTVHPEPDVSEISLPVGNLPPGIYLLMAESGQFQQVQKVRIH